MRWRLPTSIRGAVRWNNWNGFRGSGATTLFEEAEVDTRRLVCTAGWALACWTTLAVLGRRGPRSSAARCGVRITQLAFRAASLIREQQCTPDDKTNQARCKSRLRRVYQPRPGI